MATIPETTLAINLPEAQAEEPRLTDTTDPRFIVAADRYQASMKIKRFYSSPTEASMRWMSRDELQQYRIQQEILAELDGGVNKELKYKMEKFIDDRDLERQMAALEKKIELREVENARLHRQPNLDQELMDAHKRYHQAVHQEKEEECIADEQWSCKHIYEPAKRLSAYWHDRQIRIKAFYGVEVLSGDFGTGSKAKYLEFLRKCGVPDGSLYLSDEQVDARIRFIRDGLDKLQKVEAMVRQFAKTKDTFSISRELWEEEMAKYNAILAGREELFAIFAQELFHDLL